MGIKNWDGVMGLANGIEDWKLILVIGIGIWHWGLRMGIGIGYLDGVLGLEIRIRDLYWGLAFMSGDWDL